MVAQEYDIRGLDSFLIFTIAVKTIMNNQGSGGIPSFSKISYLGVVLLLGNGSTSVWVQTT
jgi:hypothetical protein